MAPNNDSDEAMERGGTPDPQRVASLEDAIRVMRAGGQAVINLPKGQLIVGATGAEFIPPNIDEEEEDEPMRSAAAPDRPWLD